MAFDFNRMAGQAFTGLNAVGSAISNPIMAPIAIAGLAANALRKPVQNAAGAAVGPVATYQLVQQPGAMPQVAALPQTVAGANKPLTLQDLYNLEGGPLAARAQQALLADQTRAESVKTAQSMYPIMEQAKKSELERQLAAAQIRSNIGTNQALMLGGAQTAQQMGLNAASQMGSALAAQYQYG
jgi:hypothetical protein